MRLFESRRDRADVKARAKGVTTVWRCGICGTSAPLALAADADPAAMMYYARQRHHRINPLCESTRLTLIFTPPYFGILAVRHA